MHISWIRQASFCHLGVISDPLIVPKFYNETHDPKGQENKIYTIVKGRETFYRRHTVPVTSCCKVKYVLKMESFGSKNCTKERENSKSDYLKYVLAILNYVWDFMDSESMVYLFTIFITVYKTYILVCKRSVSLRRFFYTPEYRLNEVIYTLCLPSFNLNI